MSDDRFEQDLQTLLDGRPLSPRSEPTPSNAVHPIGIIDAIARKCREALFGKDIPPDPPPSSRWGHLEICGEIGRGASGTVYHARDTRLARDVAVKLLAGSTESPVDALQEGRLLAQLNHPHIVRVLGADTHDGISGIWMELLEGDTLEHLLMRDGVFGQAEALRVGIDLANAVAAVHDAGLLHRDIKTGNVVRERGGRIVLMDLGAGRALAQAVSGGHEAGTPLYMAPELLGGGPATVRSDIYSLGVVLYHLLTATFPVVAADREALRAGHARRNRRSLRATRPDIHPAIADVIDRACEPEPSARYDGVRQFGAGLRQALQALLDTIPVRSSAHRA